MESISSYQSELQNTIAQNSEAFQKQLASVKQPDDIIKKLVAEPIALASGEFLQRGLGSAASGAKSFAKTKATQALTAAGLDADTVAAVTSGDVNAVVRTAASKATTAATTVASKARAAVAAKIAPALSASRDADVNKRFANLSPANQEIAKSKARLLDADDYEGLGKILDGMKSAPEVDPLTNVRNLLNQSPLGRKALARSKAVASSAGQSVLDTAKTTADSAKSDLATRAASVKSEATASRGRQARIKAQSRAGIASDGNAEPRYSGPVNDRADRRALSKAGLSDIGFTPAPRADPRAIGTQVSDTPPPLEKDPAVPVVPGDGYGQDETEKMRDNRAGMVPGSDEEKQSRVATREATRGRAPSPSRSAAQVIQDMKQNPNIVGEAAAAAAVPDKPVPAPAVAGPPVANTIIEDAPAPSKAPLSFADQLKAKQAQIGPKGPETVGTTTPSVAAGSTQDAGGATSGQYVARGVKIKTDVAVADPAINIVNPFADTAPSGTKKALPEALTTGAEDSSGSIAKVSSRTVSNPLFDADAAPLPEPARPVPSQPDSGPAPPSQPAPSLADAPDSQTTLQQGQQAANTDDAAARKVQLNNSGLGDDGKPKNPEDDGDLDDLSKGEAGLGEDLMGGLGGLAVGLGLMFLPKLWESGPAAPPVQTMADKVNPTSQFGDN